MTGDPATAWKGLLREDEVIVWQGRPVARIAVEPADLLLSGFGFVFFSFAIFWTGMAFSMAQGTGLFGYAFPLFGVPFILVGAYLLFGRFFWDAFRRGRTWYTLTDSRAFIATDIFGHRTLKNYAIEPDADIVLIERGDQQSVIFGRYRRQDAKGRNHHGNVMFELLPDGREVYGHLLAVRASVAKT